MLSISQNNLSVALIMTVSILLGLPSISVAASRQKNAARVANIGDAAPSTIEDQRQPGYRSTSALGDAVRLKLSADLDIKQDDNIFLSPTNEVSDTILSLKPGVGLDFGQGTQLHGSLQLGVAFTRYLQEETHNANLGYWSADFGYTGRHITLASDISYRQLNQNNPDVAGATQQTITRSNVTNIQSSAESSITAKTSLMVGANLSKTRYETAGFIGSKDITIPLKAYFAITPKVDLSAGFSYGQAKPSNKINTGRDLDYTLGARGRFTSKLSGQFSVGYQTRQVGDKPKDNMLSLDGSLGYELTPKTESTLAFSRDFGIGAQGASLKTTSFSYDLDTTLSAQWKLGAGIAYRRVVYGDLLFANPPILAASGRSDSYFAGNLLATYLPNQRLSTSLRYTVSTNRSTQSTATYTNNLWNLSLGWLY